MINFNSMMLVVMELRGQDLVTFFWFGVENRFGKTKESYF